MGRAVSDLLWDGLRGRVTCPSLRVTITASATPTAAGRVQLPKQELVSAVQVLLQARRFQIAQAIPETAILVRELETFQAKVALAADDSAMSWRCAPYDDLVLAAGVAVWDAERCGPPDPPMVPYVLEAGGWWQRVA